MTTIVGAFGTGHIMMRRGTAGETGERVFRGMQELGRRAAALRPDLLLMVSSDHHYNLRGDESAAFLIGVRDEFVTFGDMDIPFTTIPSEPIFARALLDEAVENGFNAGQLSEDYRPDHGVALPYLLIPEPRVPMIPILVNIGLGDTPTMKEGNRFGQLIAQVAKTFPGDRRVVVIGGGGLSHWLGVPEMGRVNRRFDRNVIDTFVRGAAGTLSSWTPSQIVEEGGNGGLEIINWAVAAATLPGCKGEEIYYEEIPEWMTGLGGVQIFA